MSQTNQPGPNPAASSVVCELCAGNRQLAFRGIMRVYLAPHWLCAIFVVAGASLALSIDPWYLTLAAAGLVWPLANADLRMILFPVVMLGKAMGKQVNCPRCEPGARIFRRSG